MSLLRFRSIVEYSRRYPIPHPLSDLEFREDPFGADIDASLPPVGRETNVLEIIFKNSKLYDHGTPTSRTDGQMDDLIQ